MVSNFADAFRAGGGEVVATLFCNPGNREFRAILTEIARARPAVTRARVRERRAKTRDVPGVTGVTTYHPETRELAKTPTRMRSELGQFVLVR